MYMRLPVRDMLVLQLFKTLLFPVLSVLLCYIMRLYRDGAALYIVLAMPARYKSVLQRVESVLKLAWGVTSLAEFVLCLDWFVL